MFNKKDDKDFIAIKRADLEQYGTFRGDLYMTNRGFSPYFDFYPDTYNKRLIDGDEAIKYLEENKFTELRSDICIDIETNKIINTYSIYFKDGTLIILEYPDLHPSPGYLVTSKMTKRNRVHNLKRGVLLYCYSTSKTTGKMVWEELMKFKLKGEEQEGILPKFSFLAKKTEGLELIDMKLNPIVVDVDLNYNLSYDYENLTQKITSNESGLILFTGKPGTGKSYLIKHLAGTYTDTKFVFLPSDFAGILTDPGFLGFAIEELQNSVIIIEDAEQALRDRNKGGLISVVSTILNATDGIIGDLLNIKILATLNTEEEIDDALLRKGRLLCKVDFQLLEVDNANKILENLEKTNRVTKPTTLTELYNTEDTGVELKERVKIGF